MKEIRAVDAFSYQNFLRMNATAFEELLSSIASKITFQDTVMRQAISPAERLAITLRFLATGEHIYVEYNIKYMYPVYYWCVRMCVYIPYLRVYSMSIYLQVKYSKA